ncbi:DUF636 domain-containing protein [Blastomyces gilchristii SLH14081]|uniref:DUF636 domain-containing protein n=1 Tax=Blastomyces gilchristii (strain SLH14081) TaxID=559298 RepID=A0A179UJA5_BLAGS|nr:DUF636 domain-containing protein [Blastomyces gilchristii SLH14081]EQL30189.1 hypothetical protein BDFG_07283 [Blastomyces dermatitidis ATCC 26199]OAT08105.1 DUF636 domain-containing protein [Blastomyces gilchristii SLH14081]
MSAATPTTTDPAPVVVGGCACSYLRYTSTALPSSLSHCFCVECRKSAGGPFQTYVRFPTTAVTWLNDRQPKYFSASTFARRGFCDKCGSSLVFQMNEHPERISLTGGSIDDWDVKWGLEGKREGEGEMEGKGEGEAGAKKDGWDELNKSSVYYWVREKPSWYKVPNDGVVKYFTDPDLEEQPPGFGGGEGDPFGVVARK